VSCLLTELPFTLAATLIVSNCGIGASELPLPL
jgi:hypothetical protein